ncbi:DUF6683 family protein [Mucilaginibacter aquatilis]|uniref:DUF4197 family protein n=1 Tax=Mucilaginibacter aquatilis TaxID=1517760 RepID=A0A6I4ID14_9SPHI|nr:DUF6683 family protein [Mucilaginibacter aquatilis]MVN91718.1 hypothetical protein [Mucilaginibacter aquatilis]
MARKLFLINCIFAYLLLSNSTAKAQQSVDLIMDNFTSSVISQTNTLLANSAIESSMRNARKGKSAKALATKVNFNYTPNKALQQKVVQQLGDNLKARNAAAGQAFFNALGPGKADYNQLFAQMVQQSGLPANNAATALAAYLEVGYVVVNNVQNTTSITAEVDKALQRQTTALLSQNKRLTTPTAISRLGEELKLQAVVLYLGWQSALQGGQSAQFSSGIDQQFKSMGLDLTKVKLTSKGLVKK